MVDPRERAVSSIEEAQLALDRALSELDTIPSIDPTIVGFAAHALSSCANTTTAAAELLQHTLAGYPDPEVATWLDGIHHAANMMQHTIGRLLHASAPSDFPLKRGLRQPPLVDGPGRHVLPPARRTEPNPNCQPRGWSDPAGVGGPRRRGGGRRQPPVQRREGVAAREYGLRADHVGGRRRWSAACATRVPG